MDTLILEERWERGWVRSTSRSAVGVSNPLRLNLRPQPRSAESLLMARPHPSPLPQERENHFAVAGEIARAQFFRDPTGKVHKGGISTKADRISLTRRQLSPLPGGEGQGEGERYH